MSEFTHFDEKGNAHMVDVSDKDITRRTASAHEKKKSGVILCYEDYTVPYIRNYFLMT